MRKNWLGMLLVLGISLASLPEASADGCIPEAGCALEDNSVPESKQATGAAVETSSGAYAPEISTNAVEALAPAALPEASTSAAVAVSVDTGAVASAIGTVTAVSSGTEKLSDYFNTETPALKKVGQAKLAELQQELQSRVNELDKRVRGMAEDGMVTSDELSDLKAALKSYDVLRYSANQELAFYRLSIPEDEQVGVYWKLALIQDGQFSADDKKESVKRFFVNLTGKDVRVKMGITDKLGLTFMGSVLTFILVVAL